MITKIMRPEEKLEIATDLLTDEQTIEYERICAAIESQRELCGFPDISTECRSGECVLHLLSATDKRILGYSCV